MDIQSPYGGKRKVSYFYNPEISKYAYAKDHPMKPERIGMAHSLIVHYRLYRELEVYNAREATKAELTRFHTPDYINYLQNYVSKDIVSKFTNLGFTTVAPGLASKYVGLPSDEERKANISDMKKRQTYKVGESTDCPGFPGLYNFCQLSTGASIDCAATIINNLSDVSINWGGGLHHAKKCQASGFCYTNDIVLAILQLLEVFPRVLYLDIDVHHGDGVEEAFFLTNRVMTVSFHQYGEEFFPGTGNIDSIGLGQGKYHSINVPLKKGITDECFLELFKNIMQEVIQRYKPNVLVMQLGADSLAHDMLGNFNLSIKGHGACLKHMLGYGIPTIMLGGGGYTVQNVSRCWAYETGVALGMQLQGPLPETDPFYFKYEWNKKLHIPTRNDLQNMNTTAELEKIREKVCQYLRSIEAAPSVQFHHVPRLASWNINALAEEESTQVDDANFLEDDC